MFVAPLPVHEMAEALLVAMAYQTHRESVDKF
jgi:hypothetical protein